MTPTPRPGDVMICTVPPALFSDLTLRGRRPVIVIGHDPVLGYLIAPVTTAVRPIPGVPQVDEGGLEGQVRVDVLRWVSGDALSPAYAFAELCDDTKRQLLSAARPFLVATGHRELYRAAKRSI